MLQSSNSALPLSSDIMELNKVSLLQSYFDYFYAKEIRDKMFSVLKSKCFGCQQSRLSQTDHICLTPVKENILWFYFDDILREVDELEVLRKWNHSAAMLDISLELIEMFKLKIYCEDWRKVDMRTIEWRDKMVKMTYQIMKLENRFDV